MRSADGRFEYRDRNDVPVPAGTAVQDVHRFAYVCRRSGMADAGVKPEALGWASFCSVNLRGRGHNLENSSWSWDGNFDQPTLAPSINCCGGKCWHGFIERGVYLDTNRQPEAKQ